jgi:hypothetical protein
VAAPGPLPVTRTELRAERPSQHSPPVPLLVGGDLSPTEPVSESYLNSFSGLKIAESALTPAGAAGRRRGRGPGPSCGGPGRQGSAHQCAVALRRRRTLAYVTVLPIDRNRFFRIAASVQVLVSEAAPLGTVGRRPGAGPPNGGPPAVLSSHVLSISSLHLFKDIFYQEQFSWTSDF